MLRELTRDLRAKSRGTARLAALGGTGEGARPHTCTTLSNVFNLRAQLYARSRGRVRQVGPPLPLMHSSLPGIVRTSKPDSRRRALVL